ncbi:DUF1501 domain-containing protein [Planctomicrobium sp. SH661]|uniref:DUF1501 domain-containing protein n=1 Tax=Planctomicrobium sp. SH661 TaxID=3448124 RepID=UPI003F5C4034
MNRSLPSLLLSRRTLLRQIAQGAGWLSLAGLLDASSSFASSSGSTDTAAGIAHFPARAKRIILLFQHGGPSQIDLFDPKPELLKYVGKPMPGGVEAFFDQQDSSLCSPSPFQFRQHGECGMHFSELLPHLSHCADDLLMIRSMHTLVNDHEGALRHFQTGKPRAGRPSIGAWLTYALGTQNRKLPPYVVLSDPNHDQVDGNRNWTSGFLPPLCQGTPLRCDGEALFDLELPDGIIPQMQQDNLALLELLNREHQKQFKHLGDLDARIANNALAGQIGEEIRSAMDLSQETAQTHQAYGMNDQDTGTYSRRCLMARRLLERGVRFVAVFNDAIMGDPWDTHSEHNARIRKISRNVDQPCAALIQDLKQRGLLEDTVVMWIGEFGRLPVTQGKDGRDHNRHAFTALVAGGGFRRGMTYGATDDFGYKITKNPLAVGELHATLLRQFGLDHAKLTYRHQGRDESLTDTDITGVQPRLELVEG